MRHQFRELALRHAQQVDSRADLTQRSLFPCTYIRQDGQCFTLKGTQRDLFNKLRSSPVFAASRMNFSAYVDKLRKAGAPIETYFYINAETGGRFGVYALSQRVSVLG